MVSAVHPKKLLKCENVPGALIHVSRCDLRAKKACFTGSSMLAINYRNPLVDTTPMLLRHLKLSGCCIVCTKVLFNISQNTYYHKFLMCFFLFSFLFLKFFNKKEQKTFSVIQEPVVAITIHLYL